MNIDVKFVTLHSDVQIPEYATPREAGADIRAWLPSGPVTLQPGRRILIKTGFRMELPEDFEAQIRPRSGLAFKHGITVLNAPGTIDETFLGELGVVLIHHGDEPFEITSGDRIAQMVIARVDRFKPVMVSELGTSDRGQGGFGSTGIR